MALLAGSLLAAPAARGDASWSLEPATWDFGVVVPGEGPVTKGFTLTNTGDEQIPGPLLVVVGGGEEGFGVGGSGCGTLEPGGECTVEATFDPSRAGAAEGELQVSPFGGGLPLLTSKLSGVGAGPAVALTPARYDFGAAAVGGESRLARLFSVRNDGQLDLTISAVELTAPLPLAPPQFRMTSATCAAGIVLAPAASCSLAIKFAPLAAGHQMARLRILSDAPGSPHVAVLEGNGTVERVRGPRSSLSPPPRAKLLHRPARRTTKRHAAFRFRGSSGATRFFCRLDRRALRPCESPVRFQRLRSGRHRFSVRALDARGLGQKATVFHWRVLAPRVERASSDRHARIPRRR